MSLPCKFTCHCEDERSEDVAIQKRWAGVPTLLIDEVKQKAQRAFVIDENKKPLEPLIFDVIS